MATFSALEAFTTLTTSIPQWNGRLDELNGQIALRQVELAQLEEHERPPTRSLRPKGSTESLRPKDSENAFFTPDTEDSGLIQDVNKPTGTEKPKTKSLPTARPLATTSSPLPVAAPLQRNSSQPIQPVTQPRMTLSKLRKRKTESLASGESKAPKYRTRSMIIVYYDSAVQTAFEDLVKFVSGSRNSMRKGKMAVKMAEMRKVAEMEVDDDDDDDDDDNDNQTGFASAMAPYRSTAMLVAQRNMNRGKAGVSEESDDDEEYTSPKLQFVSTRQMGPSRDQAGSRATNMASLGMLRGYRRSGTTGTPDIFDELDKGLEWCQSQCEHAAHQFLRDGDCSAEIENIKRRLAEVKERAHQEIQRLKEEEGETVESPLTCRPEIKPRGLSTIKVRKDFSSNLKDLEVDDDEHGEIEVDEGIVDDDGPPTLIYKKARDYAR